MPSGRLPFIDLWTKADKARLKLPKELLLFDDRSTDSEGSDDDGYVAQDDSAIADFFMGEIGLSRKAFHGLKEILAETGATEPEELSTLLDDALDGLPIIERLSKAMPVAKRRKFGELLLDMHRPMRVTAEQRFEESGNGGGSSGEEYEAGSLRRGRRAPPPSIDTARSSSPARQAPPPPAAPLADQPPVDPDRPPEAARGRGGG